MEIGSLTVPAFHIRYQVFPLHPQWGGEVLNSGALGMHLAPLVTEVRRPE